VTGISARRGSLVVVGTGITLVRQTTLEALTFMERADRLFYLVADPAAETWIRRLNSTAATLADCYAEGKPRLATYGVMADRIVAAAQSGLAVCAAFYGHPGVLVRASHLAINRLRAQGLSARMLPGISSDACLFADLCLNPGDNGCQCFEATDFLAARRRIDPTSELILWQVGVLGEPGMRRNMTCRPERMRVLTAALRRHYSASHPVVLYEAAQFPMCDPRIDRTTLARLPSRRVGPGTTLYIPPCPRRPADARILRWLQEP
jgi:hypothetical protein